MFQTKDLDPDPKIFETQDPEPDPDPQIFETLDPDPVPHEIDADPKPWSPTTINCKMWFLKPLPLVEITTHIFIWTCAALTGLTVPFIGYRKKR